MREQECAASPPRQKHAAARSHAGAGDDITREAQGSFINREEEETLENPGTQRLSETIAMADGDEMAGKYLTFWTDGQLYGVPIAHVVQIVGLQEVTQVPEFPYYAKGIINLRGAIIPVIDVRLRLGKYEAEYNERTCIIVTSIREREIGFIVDEVDEVTDIDDEFIAQPPKVAGASDTYITGIGKLDHKVVLLMDVQRVLGSTDLEMLTDLPE